MKIPILIFLFIFITVVLGITIYDELKKEKTVISSGEVITMTGVSGANEDELTFDFESSVHEVRINGEKFLIIDGELVETPNDPKS